MTYKIKKRINENEEKRITLGLNLRNSHNVVKRTLQDVCGHYEKNSIFADATDVRQLIHSHLAAKDVLVRRWALKAVALIGSPDDLQRIAERTKVETDYEAVTWATAALFKNAGDLSIQELQQRSGIDNDKPLILAARLYARPQWIRDNLKPVSVSIDDDPLALKWAVFLVGYGLAPDDLFDPRHANEVFLGQLFQHSVQEISEYSVWALWERQDFTGKHLTVGFDAAHKAPDNVRKWLYRLFTQSHLHNGLDYDIVQQMRSSDTSPAREGLARGLVDANDEKFDNTIIEWSGQEADPAIRQILLEGLARRSDHNETMFEIAQSEYKRSRSIVERTGILAASSGTKLYTELMRGDIEAGNATQTNLYFGEITNLQLNTGTGANMSNISVGGNMNAQNVVAGDMIKSANDAVQHMSVQHQSDKEVLEKTFEFLKANPSDTEAFRLTLEAIASAAAEPSRENKQTLLQRMKDLAHSGAAVASAGGGLASIIQLISGWAV